MLMRIFCGLLVLSPGTAQPRIHFEGRVETGKALRPNPENPSYLVSFRKDLGAGLVLVLIPSWKLDANRAVEDGSGWRIEIQRQPKTLKDSPDNYISCVSGSAHGASVYDIDVTDFVTEKNEQRSDAELSQSGFHSSSTSGWEGSPKNREFSFVLNDRDQQKVFDGRTFQLPGGGTVFSAAGAPPPAIRVGTGRFSITDFELSNLGPGKEARFRSIRFEVELELPPPAQNQRGPARKAKKG
jgi:hypothetical protein